MRLALFICLLVPAMSFAQQPAPKYDGKLLAYWVGRFKSAPAQAVEPKYDGKPLAYWVERFGQAENDKQREDATLALVAFGPDAAPALPTLLPLLADRSDRYRARVAEVLAGIGPAAKDAVPDLVKRLKDVSVRKPRAGRDGLEWWAATNEVLTILAAIGPDAGPAVPEILALPVGSHSRGDWLIALCRIGPPERVLPAVRTAVWRHFAPRVTQDDCINPDAITALVHLGPAVVPLLLEMVESRTIDGPHHGFRLLKMMGPQARAAIPALVRMLDHENIRARLNAAGTLWAIGKDERAVAALVRMMSAAPVEERHPDRPLYSWNVAADAVVLLGEFGSDAKAALPTLRAEVAAANIVRTFIDPPPPVNWLPFSPELGGLTWEDNERRRRIAHRLAVGVAAEEAIRKITGEPNE